jgi:succinyl-diaminopimelate desuccinylase
MTSVHEPEAAVRLAVALIETDTANSPGGEALAAGLVAGHLADHGVAAVVREWGYGRANVIARLDGTDPTAPALLLSGHLDTVGLGSQPWTADPLGGVVEGDRLYGRGSTDMKGGAAAMVVAFERLAAAWEGNAGGRSVVLALTAGEETGCEGARLIVDDLPRVGAIVVGEPTAARAVVGHKGLMWARLEARGLAAHASQPGLGRNAIAGLASVVGRISGIDPGLLAPESELGLPTIAATMIQGGSSRNVVPDSCSCVLDIRLTSTFGESQASRVLHDITAGADVTVEVDLVIPPVLSKAGDPWLESVMAMTGDRGVRRTVNYFTDASILGPALGDPPVCILGPGEPALAHRVDEWCSVTAIERCVDLYEEIARGWSAVPRAASFHAKERLSDTKPVYSASKGNHDGTIPRTA